MIGSQDKVTWFSCRQDDKEKGDKLVGGIVGIFQTSGQTDLKDPEETAEGIIFFPENEKTAPALFIKQEEEDIDPVTRKAAGRRSPQPRSAGCRARKSDRGRAVPGRAW